ncbi:hypothetical protein TL16_g05355 [Triparma laevis f. inornata]|uniref:PNPLA domain-containing protein n=1 Tax=Triparma laevis f. inornata TaxID=1714386 RepID=A0A9W7AM11_9STRA|nr:hypothetical protein TL16_g05355 [Triparma laevis f. inornata]
MCPSIASLLLLLLLLPVKFLPATSLQITQRFPNAQSLLSDITVSSPGRVKDMYVTNDLEWKEDMNFDKHFCDITTLPVPVNYVKQKKKKQATQKRPQKKRLLLLLPLRNRNRAPTTTADAQSPLSTFISQKLESTLLSTASSIKTPADLSTFHSELFGITSLCTIYTTSLIPSNRSSALKTLNNLLVISLNQNTVVDVDVINLILSTPLHSKLCSSITSSKTFSPSSIQLLQNLLTSSPSTLSLLPPSLLPHLKNLHKQTSSPLLLPTLSMLGYNPLPKSTLKRGLRILSLDGGGSRGVVTLECLRNLDEFIEEERGESICEYFDIVASERARTSWEGGGGVSVVRFTILMFNLLIYNLSTLIVSRDGLVRINSQVQL